MRYIRLYAGQDGTAHFEDVRFEKEITPAGSERSTIIPATGLIFRRSPPGQFMDWHLAASPRFVITLAGMGEKTASDGEARRLGPGTILSAEDTQGKGHQTRVIGDQERISIFILQDARPQPVNHARPEGPTTRDGLDHTRAFVGPDGMSHLAQGTIDLTERTRFGSDCSPVIPVTGVVFHRSPPGHSIDWQTSRGRCYEITLSGEADLITSDGSVCHQIAGTIVLAEDLHGKGHQTRGGDTERSWISVYLSDRAP